MKKMFKVNVKQSLLVNQHICELTGKTQIFMSSDDVYNNAKKIKKAMREASKSIYSTNQQRIAEQVSFLATVNRISEIQYVELLNAKTGKIKDVQFLNISLHFQGTEVSCFNIASKYLISKLHELNSNSLLEFTGVFLNVRVSQNIKRTIFFITEIKPITSLTKHIVCSEKIKMKAMEIINNPKINLANFIKYTLIDILRIKSIDKTPKLELALEFVILQSITDGYIDNSSARLHSLLIGAPASGKKLISDAIQILNPIFQCASSGKVSIAGLSASTSQKDNIWISKPGALPLAHNGTFTCQDFHNTSSSIQNQLMGIFAEVMENGRFKDTTSSNQNFACLTSIHLDMNKQTDLSKKKVEDFIEDIHGIPINILSRFDFIAEIEANGQRQNEIALSMYKKSKITNKQEESLIVKYIIASLKDRYKRVSITNKTFLLLRALHQELFLIQENGEISNQLSAFQTRTTISAMKYIKAIACINRREKTKEKDAKYAFKFIQEKFRVMNSLIPNGSKSTELLGNIVSNHQIKEAIKNVAKGKPFTVGQIVREMNSNSEINLSTQALQRKVYRFLTRFGKKDQHGTYVLK